MCSKRLMHRHSPKRTAHGDKLRPARPEKKSRHMLAIVRYSRPGACDPNAILTN